MDSAGGGGGGSQCTPHCVVWQNASSTILIFLGALYYTLYTIVYTIHYNIHYTLYTIYYILYTIYYTLYTGQEPRVPFSPRFVEFRHSLSIPVNPCHILAHILSHLVVKLSWHWALSVPALYYTLYTDQLYTDQYTITTLWKVLRRSHYSTG